MRSRLTWTPKIKKNQPAALFTSLEAVVEVIHHYTKEDLKRYDKVIHLKKVVMPIVSIDKLYI